MASQPPDCSGAREGRKRNRGWSGCAAVPRERRGEWWRGGAAGVMMDPLRGTASEGHLTQPRAQEGERGSQVWGASVGLLSREGRRTCYDSAHLTDRPVTESPTPPRPAGPVPPCGPVSRWAGATTAICPPSSVFLFPLIPSFPSMAKARSFPPSDLAALAETVSPFPTLPILHGPYHIAPHAGARRTPWEARQAPTYCITLPLPLTRVQPSEFA